MFSFNLFEKKFGVLGDELLDTAGTVPGFGIAHLLFADGTTMFFANRQSIILPAGV